MWCIPFQGGCYGVVDCAFVFFTITFSAIAENVMGDMKRHKEGALYAFIFSIMWYTLAYISLFV